MEILEVRFRVFITMTELDRPFQYNRHFNVLKPRHRWDHGQMIGWVILALAVNKAPAVYILSPTLDGL